MIAAAEATRRNAALRVMRRFAHENGFVLGEVRKVDSAGRVDLIAAAPDGREFGIGYEKVNEPTA